MKDPICGMEVDAASLRSDFEGQPYYFCSSHCQAEFLANPKRRRRVWATYHPLILIFAYLLALTFLAELGSAASDPGRPQRMMNHFMGGFFIAFSFFKFLDLPGFARAYRTYDLPARFIPGYAWFYPFVELLLGGAYLSGMTPQVVRPVTVFLMLAGSAGVAQALLRKNHIECACLGTVFKLPMTYVTFAEDLLMGAMALAGWLIQ